MKIQHWKQINNNKKFPTILGWILFLHSFIMCVSNEWNYYDLIWIRPSVISTQSRWPGISKTFVREITPHSVWNCSQVVFRRVLALGLKWIWAPSKYINYPATILWVEMSLFITTVLMPITGIKYSKIHLYVISHRWDSVLMVHVSWWIDFLIDFVSYLLLQGSPKKEMIKEEHLFI